MTVGLLRNDKPLYIGLFLVLVNSSQSTNDYFKTEFPVTTVIHREYLTDWLARSSCEMLK